MLTDRVDDELLERAGPGLRVVANFAVGFDKRYKDRGIRANAVMPGGS